MWLSLNSVRQRKYLFLLMAMLYSVDMCSGCINLTLERNWISSSIKSDDIVLLKFFWFPQILLLVKMWSIWFASLTEISEEAIAMYKINCKGTFCFSKVRWNIGYLVPLRSFLVAFFIPTLTFIVGHVFFRVLFGWSKIIWKKCRIGA